MCIQYTHQKSWKLDEGIMMIFASEKIRPLFLSKGVYLYIICHDETNDSYRLDL